MTATEPHPGDRGPRDCAAGRELLDRDALNPGVGEVQAVNLSVELADAKAVRNRIDRLLG